LSFSSIEINVLLGILNFQSLSLFKKFSDQIFKLEIRFYTSDNVRSNITSLIGLLSNKFDFIRTDKIIVKRINLVLPLFFG
jgi:hypothetical protein